MNIERNLVAPLETWHGYGVKLCAHCLADVPHSKEAHRESVAAAIATDEYKAQQAALSAEWEAEFGHD